MTTQHSSSSNNRRRTRRVFPWDAPLTEVQGPTVLSPNRRSKRLEAAASPTRRQSNRTRATTPTATIATIPFASPVRTRSTLSSDLKQMRDTINQRRRSVGRDRIRAQNAIQEARDLRNEVHASLQSHFLHYNNKEDRAPDSSASSLESSTGSSSLLDEDEELNEFLIGFLGSLIEEEANR